MNGHPSIGETTTSGAATGRPSSLDQDASAPAVALRQAVADYLQVRRALGFRLRTATPLW